METKFILMVLILVILVVLGILSLVMALVSKKKRKPDYYTFFIMGIIWLAVGLPLKNYILWVMGLIFMIFGFIHRKEWDKNRSKWADKTKQEKMIASIIIGILGLLVLAGLVVFYLVKIGVLNF